MNKEECSTKIMQFLTYSIDFVASTSPRVRKRLSPKDITSLSTLMNKEECSTKIMQFLTYSIDFVASTAIHSLNLFYVASHIDQPEITLTPRVEN